MNTERHSIIEQLIYGTVQSLQLSVALQIKDSHKIFCTFNMCRVPHRSTISPIITQPLFLIIPRGEAHAGCSLFHHHDYLIKLYGILPCGKPSKCGHFGVRTASVYLCLCQSMFLCVVCLHIYNKLYWCNTFPAISSQFFVICYLKHHVAILFTQASA